MDFSLSEWISILKLSTMWEFMGLRQYAITQIPKVKIPPAKQINLARDYHIQEWFLPGLVAYAQQADAITADDIDLLGWEFVLKLLQARERRCRGRMRPDIQARVNHSYAGPITVVFRDEIESVRQIYPA
jgi:hypothetical protein